MMHRRRSPPDRRPRWNDPDLRVGMIRNDGGMDMLPAETVTRLAEYMLSINVMPDWRDDPTYNLRHTKRP